MERDREIMDEGGEIDRPTSSLEREDAAAQTVDSNRGDEWTGAWLENVSGSDVVGVPGVPACVPLRLSAPPASPTILIGRQRSLVDMCASPPPFVISSLLRGRPTRNSLPLTDSLPT